MSEETISVLLGGRRYGHCRRRRDRCRGRFGSGLWIEAAQYHLKDGGKRVELLFDLLICQFAQPGWDVKDRRIDIRAEIFQFHRHASLITALHLSGRQPKGFGAQGESGLLIDINEALGRDITNRRPSSGEAGMAKLCDGSPVKLFFAHALDAAQTLELKSDLAWRQQTEIETHQIRSQLGELVARGDNQVPFVITVEKDELPDGWKIDRVAAVRTVPRDIDRQRERLWSV